MKDVIIKSSVAAANGGAMEADTIQNGHSSKSHRSRCNILRRACFALLTASIIFSGCDKDDDKNKDDSGDSGGAFDGKTIKATVENGKNYNAVISKVTAEAWVDGVEITEEVGSGSYSNGGFTIKLPESPKNNIMYDIERFFGEDGVTISDDNTVKYIELDDFYGLDKNNNRVGTFFFGKVINEKEEHYVVAYYCYVSKDVNITGGLYSLSLKKGWNLVYETDKNGETIEMSNKAISGLKRYFGEGDDE